MFSDCCPSQAKVEAVLKSGRSLYLCGHHAQEAETHPDIDCYHALKEPATA